MNATTIPTDESTVRRKRLNVQRVLRSRRRKAEGGCCIRIDVAGDDIAALVEVGALDASRCREPDAVKAAVMRLSGIGFRAVRSGAQKL